jgi:hypothetical protein
MAAVANMRRNNNKHKRGTSGDILPTGLKRAGFLRNKLADLFFLKHVSS